MADTLLQVEGLVKEFDVRRNLGIRSQKLKVQAVSNVSFSVDSGETLGLVGESGSGKTTLGRCVLRLLEPTAGSIVFKGQEIVGLSSDGLRALRRDMQIVFQDPFASLDPKRTVQAAIAEPLEIQRVGGDHPQRVRELLELVGLSPDHARRYPHEFSGGQRQRIGIARALALNPSLLILDEPVSALDVSIQAQVLNLLGELQTELNLAYMFIAHDLSVVRHTSDRIAVMYLGKIVELGDSETIYENPAHPYTHALLSAVPVPDPEVERARQRIVLTGDVPSPINPPSGCRFHTRCPIAQDRCRTEEPAMRTVTGGQSVACHFPLEPGVTLVELAGRAAASA